MYVWKKKNVKRKHILLQRKFNSRFLLLQQGTLLQAWCTFRLFHISKVDRTKAANTARQLRYAKSDFRNRIHNQLHSTAFQL